MDIHECTVEDLADLNAWMPLGTDAHLERLDRQAKGDCTYLVASSGGPVGVCIVRWGGPFDAGVAELWPGCVEVNHLHVLPAARNRGVGRALIETAEALCGERDVELIGLAVADDNSDAARLYERLGYVDSRVRFVTDYEYFDAKGETRQAHERNRFLFKRLRSTIGSS